MYILLHRSRSFQSRPGTSRLRSPPGWPTWRSSGVSRRRTRSWRGPSSSPTWTPPLPPWSSSTRPWCRRRGKSPEGWKIASRRCKFWGPDSSPWPPRGLKRRGNTEKPSWCSVSVPLPPPGSLLLLLQRPPVWLSPAGEFPSPACCPSPATSPSTAVEVRAVAWWRTGSATAPVRRGTCSGPSSACPALSSPSSSPATTTSSRSSWSSPRSIRRRVRPSRGRSASPRRTLKKSTPVSWKTLKN